MAQNAWAETALNPLKIVLDAQNPRIEVAGDADQDEIRLKLLAHEDVVKLAIGIVEFGGLMPGERIIVCKENRKYVVVEGNRRVCACQLLLKPELVPEKFKKRFPIASQELKDAIKEIKADIAPDRDAAEPTITKRHTEPGIERWRTTAKMRRASKLLEAGYDLAQIAEKLGARHSVLRASIREYRLLRYVLDLGHRVWSQNELERLTDQTLQTNPYTRFFTLAGVKEKLGLSFDEHDHVTTSLSTDVFDQYMHHIARCFFIPIPPNKKPWANTRTTSEEVFASFALKKDGLHFSGNDFVTGGGGVVTPPSGGGGVVSPSGKPASGSGRTNKPKPGAPKSAKASTFFEKLICTVDDDRLIALTDEITRIQPADFPIASAMLLRALFESALTYQVRKAGKSKELNKKSNGRDVGLQTLISFCANSQNQIFFHKRASDALDAFEKAGLKEHLDFIVHGRWIEAEAAVVETAARLLRPLIAHIVEGQDHDMEEESA
ncbi:hypothetical protein [Aquitalea aquatica]|uniref:ParB/Sulfiredoxin domain-containing protein n=1 Tax=Aquitalea aquatica TaxID=3044273 RepID=A0A838Y3M9_9NEIS|nr:hypothetical protein [Aquitalea magnusonii]MBA4709286.1 hypothetical protein [Aquitalea magnusonii]